jgi:DNA-binding transcriptional regulator YiaG
MDWAQELRQWRERVGLSQPNAAAFLGVPLGTFRQWEQRRRVPPPYVLEGLRRRMNEKGVSG